jgi:hypothetical protein
MRTKLLSDRELPTAATSITDRENRDPSLAMPNSDTEEPTRSTLLNARLAPSSKKSKTDKLDPKRA